MIAKRRVGLPSRVLVVGGGFIGSHVVHGFRQRGVPVQVLTRSHPTGWSRSRLAGVRVLVGDAEDPTAVERSLEGVDHVVWCAGGLLPIDSNARPVDDVLTSLPPLLVTLSCLARHDDVRLTFLSSGGTVYGNPTVLPVPEHHYSRPITSHGVMKVAAEHYLALFEDVYGVSSCILRCGNVYGEGQQPGRSQGLIATVLAHVAAGTPVVVYGDGGAVRDFVYVSDVVDVVCTLAGRAGVPRVLNVGTGVGTTVNDVLDVVHAVTGRRVEVEYTSGRTGDVQGVVLDIELLRSLFAYEPRTLPEGVAQTWTALAEAGQLAR